MEGTTDATPLTTDVGARRGGVGAAFPWLPTLRCGYSFLQQLAQYERAACTWRTATVGGRPLSR